MNDEDRIRIDTALQRDAARMNRLAAQIDGGEARNDSQRSTAAWNLRDEANRCLRLAESIRAGASA